MTISITKRYKIKHFAESFVDSIVSDFLKEPSHFHDDIENAFNVGVKMSIPYLGTSWIFKRNTTKEEENFCEQCALEHVEYLRKLTNLHVACAPCAD